MTWHVAVSTGCCITMPVLTTLQAFHDAGVHAVELATQPRHFDPWRHDEVVVLAHRLRELRMTPVAVHAPFGGLLDLTDPNPHHRHATIGAILSAVSALRGKPTSSQYVETSVGVDGAPTVPILNAPVLP